MRIFLSRVVLISMFVCGSAMADTDSVETQWFADGSSAGGMSHLTRIADDKILLTVDVRGLVPGDATTLWWVVFNNPAGCSDDMCGEDDFNPDGIAAAEIAVGNATGNIVKSDGTLEFGAVLHEGMNEMGHQVLFNTGFAGPNFLNAGGAMNAEVHIVVQSHGQERGGKKLLEQLAFFEANCTPSCVDIQFAVHRP